MNKPNFTKRDKFPVCTNRNLIEVYSINYDDPVLIKYLKDFYNQQGGIEFEYIKNAIYTLLECSECKLIFQQYVPNEYLMSKLYEHWIDRILR